VRDVHIRSEHLDVIAHRLDEVVAVVNHELQIERGVHTGEVDRIGHDIAGIAVHIAARIAALAGPGEVFASGTVRDLVAGSGLVFEDRGIHELRGVPGEWRTYAVVDQDQPTAA